jgi:mannonate dehydratase
LAHNRNAKARLQFPDLPGWGVEIDKKAAAKYRFDSSQPLNGGWGAVRLPDGSIIHQ